MRVVALTLLVGLFAALLGAIWLRSHRQDSSQAQPQVNRQKMFQVREDSPPPQEADDEENWYDRAASSWGSSAQYDLGLQYESGHNGEKDKVKAFAWLGVAGARGNPDAKEERRRLQKEMSTEEIAKANLLTIFYLKRIHFLQAAGMLEREAPVTSRDVLSDTLRRYQREALRGDPEAQFNLGMMYAVGEGVPVDFVSAYAWLVVAAEAGYGDAVEARDFVAARMDKDMLAAGQALSREYRQKYGAPTP